MRKKNTGFVMIKGTTYRMSICMVELVCYVTVVDKTVYRITCSSFVNTTCYSFDYTSTDA